MRRWWRDNRFIVVALCLLGAFTGLLALRYVAWAAGHPEAPWWAFLLSGGR